MEHGTSGSGRRDTLDIDAEFLEHFGVKGMRWGVVRNSYQSKRDAIKNSRGGRASKAVSDALVTKDARAVKRVKTKMKVIGVDGLTNKDLQLAIQRMNLEVQYSQLKKAQFDESMLGKGKRFVGKFFGAFVTEAASAAANGAAGGNSAGSYSWGSPASIAPRRRAIGS